MILTLKLARDSAPVDAADGIELRGVELRIVNRPEPVARFQIAGWQHAGQRCAYIECRATLWLHFLSDTLPGCILGPFARVRVHDLHVFANRQRVAKLSIANDHWLRDGTQESWPVLRVLPSRPVNFVT